jgi:hypothetical protein
MYCDPNNNEGIECETNTTARDEYLSNLQIVLYTGDFLPYFTSN